MADTQVQTAEPSSPAITAEQQNFHSKRDAPDEVISGELTDEYLEFRKQTDIREPYRIPSVYLEGTKPFAGLSRPETPLIAFINARSGGYVGARLAGILYRALGQNQVFDVATCHPAKVLDALYKNLQTSEASGEPEPAYIRQHLRILVAGGDGTITWVLGCIRDLGLDPMPAVGVMPLGTGNDLSLSFGWGKSFDWKWVKGENLYETLVRYRDAEIRYLDCWEMTVSAPGNDYFKETPHSLRIDSSTQKTAKAMFWNYFSIGLDAKAAYGFHALREKHPHLTSGALMNQTWYAWFSCSSGWFCGAPRIANNCKIRVKKSLESDWEDVALPPSLGAIVLLNLQSYGGGRDIWGLAASNDLKSKGLNEPDYNDGMLEIVGFHSGWHAAVVMGQVNKNIHARRLAQAVEVEITLDARSRIKGDRGMTHMQLDGEPWPQEIPQSGEPEGPLVVKISQRGSNKVLYNGEHIIGAKNVQKLAVRGAELTHSKSRARMMAETSSALQRINTVVGNGASSSV